MALALPFAVAFVVSAVLVALIRAGAVRLGYITVPPHGMHAPSKTKARFGGSTVPLTLLICAPAIDAFSSVPVLLACSAALFVFGLASDFFAPKPSTRVVALIAVASIFLFFDRRLHWADSVTLDTVVTVFWIVGVTSAFNLLDNIDGLCGGIALIAGTAFLITVLPVPPGDPRMLQMQYVAVLLGAVAGFLIYNIYPASVALGDAGSLVIGLNMAAMTLEISPGRGSDLLSIIAVPALVLLIPIADAMFIAVSRMLSTSAAAPREYSSHRLVAIGLSERKAVGLLWLLAAVSGLIGIIADRSEQGLTGLIAAMFMIALALLAAYLARVRIYEDADPDRLPGAITPFGIESGYRRRLAEVLLDLLLVSVAYYGAYRLRFEGVERAANFSYFLESFPIILGTQTVALFAVGAYRGMWRYFGISDGVMFAKGVFLGVVTAQAVILYLFRFRDYSLSVFVVYAMLLFLLLVGSRASFRVVTEFVQRQRQVGRRLLIYGAGDRGSLAVRRLLHDPRSAYRILGFIDDDEQKRNVRVHGYRILGGYEQLVDMIMAGGVDAIVLTHESMRAAGLESLCARYGVALFRLRLEWLELSAPQPSIEPEIASVRVVERLPVLPLHAETVVRHAFSVDVEDWFHGIPVDRATKDTATPRLERGLHMLLDLLGERGARATFFILGPLVHNHAAVLRRIAAEGHELGCHGWSHELVYDMTPRQFAEDTRQARDAISDLTGRPVQAFRAPYFSITRRSLWALEVLAEMGFKYDSSIFPVRNWRYGIEDFSRDPVLLTTPSGPLWEFPISVIERYGHTIPVSGGAYFRLYPYSLTRANFKAQERSGRSVIFYLHPWELDPHHPQVTFAWKPRFTHYANLQSSRPKLVRLLREFSFGTIGDVLAARA